MNLIVKTFLVSVIFCVINVAIADTTDREAGDQSAAKTITMGDQNSPYPRPEESGQQTSPTSESKDEKTQTQGDIKSEENELMEQSQSMDESTVSNGNKAPKQK